MSSKQFRSIAALVVAIMVVTSLGVALGWSNNNPQAAQPQPQAVAQAETKSSLSETEAERDMTAAERAAKQAEIEREAGMTAEERAREEKLKANGMSEADIESAEEYELLHEMEGYWQHRLSYPTGNFQTAWVVEAAKQDAQVARGVPAGQVTYNRDSSQSPLALDPNAFTSLGPQPLQSNGCLGCYSYGKVSGRVNSIAIDPVQNNVAYLAAVGGGVWKTINCCTSTTTWTPVTDDPLISTVSLDDITIDPSNHNNVYAGTGDLNFGSFSMGSAGILKSTDQGSSWTVVGTDVFTPGYPQPAGRFPQYNAVGKVRVDPRNSNNLVAGTKTGVFFSYDQGTNWAGPCTTNAFTDQRQDTTALNLINNGSSTDIIVAVGARGISTTVQSSLAENGANGIYKGTIPASGCPTNWQLISTPSNGWPAGTGSGIPVRFTGGDTLGRIDMAIAPSNPQTMYAIVQGILGGFQYSILGVWRTTDGGATWQQRGDANTYGGCDDPGAQNWYNQSITVDPNNPDNIFVDAIDIFKSTDGGSTGNNVTCGYAGGNTVHVDQHALAYVPSSSSVMLAGNDGGIYVTTNANAGTPTFSQLNDTMSTIEFYGGDITKDFATSANPGINAGAQDNGSPVYVWTGQTQGPALWQLRKGGDGMFARIEPMQNLRWYQESQNGNLAVTTNGPYSGQVNATGGWTGDRKSFVFPYRMAKYGCPNTGCTHLIAGSYRVWETILGGVPTSSWQANSPDLTKGTLNDRSFINQLSYAVSLSTTAIVGTNDGNVWYGFGLGAGTANSATWANVTGGNSTLPNRPILDVSTDPNSPTIGYAAIGGFDQNTPATPGHVYQVTCNSDCTSFTWANKSGNLPNIPADSILANPLYRQQVFVGTDWGLYFTNDIDATTPVWQRFQNGLPNVMIWEMSIDNGFTTLALFTRARGAYAWPLPAGPVGGTPTPGGATATAQASSTVQATATSILPTATVPLPTLTLPSLTTTPGATSTAQATSTSVLPTTTAQATGTAQATTTVAPSPTGCPVINFTDVTTGNIFYDDIQFLACRRIINGYPNGDGTFRFEPNGNAKRGEFAKIAVNAFAIPAFTPTSPTFVDVPANNIFYAFIEAAANSGVIQGLTTQQCIALGTPGRCFGPNQNVTRGQVAAIVQRARTFTPVTPATPTFSDVPSNYFAYVAIETLADRDIINGAACPAPQTGQCFRPNDNIRRGELSRVTRRSMESPQQ